MNSPFTTKFSFTPYIIIHHFQSELPGCNRNFTSKTAKLCEFFSRLDFVWLQQKFHKQNRKTLMARKVFLYFNLILYISQFVLTQNQSFSNLVLYYYIYLHTISIYTQYFIEGFFCRCHYHANFVGWHLFISSKVLLLCATLLTLLHIVIVIRNPLLRLVTRNPSI